MDESLKKKFGKRVKELRKSLKLTQEQMAEMVNLEPPNVSKMENGLHFPLPDKIEKLAIALQVDIKELFDFEHFQSRQILLDKIYNYLENAQEKDLEFVYKFICGLKHYEHK